MKPDQEHVGFSFNYDDNGGAHGEFWMGLAEWAGGEELELDVWEKTFRA